MTIRAQYSAFCYLGQDCGERVSASLDHVRQVNERTLSRAVFGGGIKVIELKGGRVNIVSTIFAPTLQLDAVSYLSRCALGFSHVSI